MLQPSLLPNWRRTFHWLIKKTSLHTQPRGKITKKPTAELLRKHVTCRDDVNWPPGFVFRFPHTHSHTHTPTHTHTAKEETLCAAITLETATLFQSPSAAYFFSLPLFLFPLNFTWIATARHQFRTTPTSTSSSWRHKLAPTSNEARIKNKFQHWIFQLFGVEFKPTKRFFHWKYRLMKCAIKWSINF